MKAPRIVHLKWVDSTAHSGWGSLTSAYTDEDLICETAGYLVRSDRDSVVIAASTTHMGREREFNNSMVIPRSAIRGRIEVLKK